MNAGVAHDEARAPVAARVLPFDRKRIERAIATRARYRYVKPSVVAEGQGWAIRSPNCSRNIDPEGGEIPIAWFEPGRGGLWRLHAWNHEAGEWMATRAGLTLDEALLVVCEDLHREYWP